MAMKRTSTVSFRAVRWIHRLDHFTYVASIALTPVITLLITYSVIFRYVFGNPLIFPLEVSGYALLYLAILPLGYVERIDRHVRVDLLSEVFGSRFRRVSTVFSSLVTLVVAGALAIGSFGVLIQQIESGAGMPTTLRPPAWIFFAVVPLGFALLAVQPLLRLLSRPETVLHANPSKQ